MKITESLRGAVQRVEDCIWQIPPEAKAGMLVPAISPGGIGFDINCGMRLIRTDLTEAEVRPRLHELVAALFRSVPSGVGAKGFVRLSPSEFKTVMAQGAGWCMARAGTAGRRTWPTSREAAACPAPIPSR